MHSLLIGLRDFHSTSPMTSTLLEKVMQVKISFF